MTKHRRKAIRPNETKNEDKTSQSNLESKSSESSLILNFFNDETTKKMPDNIPKYNNDEKIQDTSAAFIRKVLPDTDHKFDGSFAVSLRVETPVKKPIEKNEKKKTLAMECIDCLKSVNKYKHRAVIEKLTRDFAEFEIRTKDSNLKDRAEAFITLNLELNEVRVTSSSRGIFHRKSSIEKALDKIEKTIKTSDFYNEIPLSNRDAIEGQKKSDYLNIKDLVKQPSRLRSPKK